MPGSSEPISVSRPIANAASLVYIPSDSTTVIASAGSTGSPACVIRVTDAWIAGNGSCWSAVMPIASELPGSDRPASSSVRNGISVPTTSPRLRR